MRDFRAAQPLPPPDFVVGQRYTVRFRIQRATYRRLLCDVESEGSVHTISPTQILLGNRT